MIYLYDPRTNIKTETTYDELAGITGYVKSYLASAKCRKHKLKNINCYIIDDHTTLNQRKELYSKEKYLDETWLMIKGSDNQFMISNYGRVKRVYNSKSSFILPYKHKKGFLRIKVQFNGSYKEYQVSQLVGYHFLGSPKSGQVLRHKNGILTDNFVGNMEYVSRVELGRRTGFKAKSNPIIQLDANTKEVINEFRSAREAGRNCFLSYQSILDRCKGKYSQGDGWIFIFADEYYKESAV